MTDHLTLPEVMAVHADQIARYGGRPGVRGSGHLEAALFRPKTGHYLDVIEEAAALWESLAQYHPFIDGNERTAFASTYAFLTINGVQLRATAEDTYSFIADLYPTNGFNFEVLVPWLRGHVKPGP
ncbi:MAG TPA: type II toxin-antitoxin system death-on-curing family toxin [Steroidobacteraceae bacterium]|jgi:death-on-curing protein|nr:type II toxin-antitoxin system death-on-curing family toxin [Steroidobacteraceae bacterium]